MQILLLLPVLLIIFYKEIFKMLGIERKTFLKVSELRGCDAGGCGHYGASRTGGRIHQGLDILIKAGSDVVAPFNCVLNRIGYVYSGSTKYRLLEVIGTGKFKDYKCKIMYCDTEVLNVGKSFKQFEKIGFAQNISEKYASVKPHLHYEMYKPNGERINPEIYVS